MLLRVKIAIIAELKSYTEECGGETWCTVPKKNGGIMVGLKMHCGQLLIHNAPARELELDYLVKIVKALS